MSLSAHHTGPQAQTRLADSVLIYVKSLLKILQTVNSRHQKTPCFNITHSCRTLSQMIPPVKKLHILITLENSTGHKLWCCCLRKPGIYRLCMWFPRDALEEHLSLSSSRDSASLSCSSLILPMIQSVIEYSICCTDPYPCSSATWRWGNALGT